MNRNLMAVIRIKIHDNNCPDNLCKTVIFRCSS